MNRTVELHTRLHRHDIVPYCCTLKMEQKSLFFQFLFHANVLTFQVAQAAGLPEELISKAKQSRSEKKARKAMSKLGEYLKG